MKTWHYGKLELNWYSGGDGGRNATGFVWSTEPVYFAATILARDNRCVINTTGLRGLTTDEYTSLREFLNSMLGDGTCICITREE